MGKTDENAITLDGVTQAYEESVNRAGWLGPTMIHLSYAQAKLILERYGIESLAGMEIVCSNETAQLISLARAVVT